jgi:glutathione synthase
MYPLDGSEEGLEGRKLAVTNPEEYVLKPQREGGGNNIFRSRIPKFLESVQGEGDYKAYILMELIRPPTQMNFIIRDGRLRGEEVVSELGIFGTIMWDKDGQVFTNEQGGWLVRTKPNGNDEGGINTGIGCYDSLCLT